MKIIYEDYEDYEDYFITERRLRLNLSLLSVIKYPGKTKILSDLRITPKKF